MPQTLAQPFSRVSKTNDRVMTSAYPAATICQSGGSYHPADQILGCSMWIHDPATAGGFDMGVHRIVSMEFGTAEDFELDRSSYSHSHSKNPDTIFLC